MTEYFFGGVNCSFKNSTQKVLTLCKVITQLHFIPYAHFHSYACVFLSYSIHCIGHLTFLHICLTMQFICSIYLNVFMNKIHYFPSMQFTISYIFFLLKSSAFGFFVHSFHGSSCSIKEKIVLLNAQSSGTYGLWRPVNGGRLEALRSKTFRDEFSISPGSFTP